jgi:hypothetical protein
MRIKKRVTDADQMLSYGRQTNIGYYYSTVAVQAEIKRLLDLYKAFIKPGPVTFSQPGHECIVFDDPREFEAFFKMLMYERGKAKWLSDLRAQLGEDWLIDLTDEELDNEYKSWLKHKRKKKWTIVASETITADESVKGDKNESNK